MAWPVEFDPAPAITRTRPRATPTAARMMISCSDGVRVDASPAVSPATIAVTPASIWRSQSLANAMRSIRSLFSNGVGRSGMMPASQAVEWTRFVIGYHAAFSIQLNPCRYADSTRPCWHRTPASGAGGGGGIGGEELAADVELDFARQLDDGFGMMVIFEQRVFDGLGAVDEQAAIETVLFLRDPVAAAVATDEDDRRCRAARG